MLRRCMFKHFLKISETYLRCCAQMCTGDVPVPAMVLPACQNKKVFDCSIFNQLLQPAL